MTNKLPDIKTFFTSAPLYEKYTYESKEVFDAAKLIFFNETLDSYCIECGKDSTFYGNNHLPEKFILKRFEKLLAAENVTTSDPSVARRGFPAISNNIHQTKLHCTRDNNHIQIFIVLTENHSLLKIGQTPSLADLSIPAIKKYRKILGSDRYREYTKSLGLFAHSVGAGSLIYLRRIFESLIHDAFVQAEIDKTINKEDYKNFRIKEKIKALSDYLPNFLVENPEMYSYLSDGLHNLSEEQCMKYFPVLDSAIQLILEEILEEKKHQEKLDAARSALDALGRK